MMSFGHLDPAGPASSPFPTVKGKGYLVATYRGDILETSNREAEILRNG